MAVHQLNVDPVIKCAMTTVFPMFDAQLSPCKDFEIRMADCLEAYGLIKGKEKCQDYITDMKECLRMGKQIQRIQLMRAEYVRQYRAGERKEMYEKSPELDAY